MCAAVIRAPGYALKKREQEMYERMKALREADRDAAAAMAALEATTRQTHDDAESINRVNRGRLR